MTNKQKANTYATIGTILFLVLLFLLLWFVYISAPKDIDEEGIELAFSEEEMFGNGDTWEEVNPAPAEAGDPGVSSEPTPSISEPTHAEELITSNEESLAAAEKAKKEKEQREAEERARKEKEDDAKRKADEMAKILNAAGSGSSLSGGGNGGGGNSNNPVTGPGGSGRDNRIQGLDGRNLRDGKLPTPECKPSQPGTVAVKIRIDKDGNVKTASSSNAVGTNMGDPEFVHCIEEMLRHTKWTTGTGDAEGTITYKFKQIDQ
jgi:hypothetical protein